MNFLEEIGGQVIIDVVLNYPGAAIRWVLLRGKKPLSVLKKDPELNSFIAIVAIALIVGLVATVRSY